MCAGLYGGDILIDLAHNIAAAKSQHKTYDQKLPHCNIDSEKSV